MTVMSLTLMTHTKKRDGYPKQHPTLLYCYANKGEKWRRLDSEMLPSQAAGDSASQVLDRRLEHRLLPLYSARMAVAD